MKILLAAIGFSFLLFTSSCKVDDAGSIISNATVTSSLIGDPSIPTSWRITYFFNSGTDGTANYTGFNFIFSSTGTLKAVNGGTIVTGTWSVVAENDGVKVLISFASPASFAKLSEDWKVIENNNIKTRLQNGNDYLTFEQ